MANLPSIFQKKEMFFFVCLLLKTQLRSPVFEVILQRIVRGNSWQSVPTEVDLWEECFKAELHFTPKINFGI